MNASEVQVQVNFSLLSVFLISEKNLTPGQVFLQEYNRISTLLSRRHGASQNPKIQGINEFELNFQRENDSL